MSLLYRVDEGGLVRDLTEIPTPPPVEKRGLSDAERQRRSERSRNAAAQRKAAAEAERQAQIERARATSGSAVQTLQVGQVEASRLHNEPAPIGKRPYQRDLVEERALKFALAFDWGLFTPVIVAARQDKQGHFWVLDGQHHLAAAVLVHGPGVVVPVQVVKADTYERRAQLFDLLNGQRTAVQFAHRFGVRLQWGEEEAKAIRAVVERVGLAIQVERNAVKDGQIACLGSVSRIYRIGGGAALQEVLQIIRDAWDFRAEAYRSAMVEGVFGFAWRYHNEYRRERLIHVCKMRKPSDVYEDATRSEFAAKMPVAVGYTLHGYYNLDLRSTPRLPAFQVQKSERDLLAQLSRRYRDQMKATGSKV
jgi:hypothetical protein